MKKWKSLAWAGCILFGVNVLLHYFSQRPLWNDELRVFTNIQNLSIPELFAPLLRLQAFPRVYLAGVSWLSHHFHHSLFALRLPSLVCMVLAFAIWVKLYRESFSSIRLFALAVFTFAASYRLTYFAAELKPYSMDVLAVAATLLFCSYQRRERMQPNDVWGYLASAFLPFFLLFSYGAAFVFWIPAYNFFVMTLKDKRFLAVFLLSAVAVIIAVTLSYLYDLRYSMGVQGLQDYWSSYFIRLDSLSGFFGPLTEGIKKMVVFWGATLKWQRRFFMVFIPFFLYGLFVKGFRVLRQGQWRIDHPASMGLVIFCELFVLSLLHKYVFTGLRLTLFFAPFVFYFILWGVEHWKAPRLLKNGFFLYFFCFNVMCAIHSVMIYLNVYRG